MGLSENIKNTTKAVKEQASSSNFGMITPSDTVELKGSRIPTALFIGGAGNLNIVDQRGVESTVTVPAGVTIRIRPKFIKDAGTTATEILALYD